MTPTSLEGPLAELCLMIRDPVADLELQELARFGEFEDGNLRVGRLLIVVEQEMAAHRLHPPRQADAEAPAGHVHLVDALIADVAVAVFPEPVPVVMEILAQ